MAPPDGATSAVLMAKPFIDPRKTTPKQELTPGAAGGGSIPNARAQRDDTVTAAAAS